MQTAVAVIACSPLWLQTCHWHVCLTRRALYTREPLVGAATRTRPLHKGAFGRCRASAHAAPHPSRRSRAAATFPRGGSLAGWAPCRVGCSLNCLLYAKRKGGGFCVCKNRWDSIGSAYVEKDNPSVTCGDSGRSHSLLPALAYERQRVTAHLRRARECGRLICGNSVPANLINCSGLPF